MKFLKAYLFGALLGASAWLFAAPPTATLSWDPYATGDVTLFGITGYEIDRSIQPLGTTCTNLLTYTKITSIAIPATAPSFTDNAQILGKRQCYQVEGIDTLGISSPSNAAGKDFPLSVPPAPTGLTVQ